MKHTNKFLVPFIFVISALAGITLNSCKNPRQQDKTPVIAFYKVEENTAKSMQQAIQEYCQEKSIEVVFSEINDSETLEKQINEKDIRLVFTSAGNAQRTVSKFTEENAGISENIFENLSISIRQCIIYDEKNPTIASAVPVLHDNIELDVNMNRLRNGEVTVINTIGDLENFALEQKKAKNDIEYPLMFAGKDPVNFFDLLGALCEAIDGPRFYDDALEIINNSAENPAESARLLLTDPKAPMVNTAITLKRFFAEGLIYQGCFNFTEKDLQGFCKQDFTTAMFMTLSQHRQFKDISFRSYKNSYIPSVTETPERNFTANIVYAVPLTPGNQVNSLVKELLSDEFQEKLCYKTGLAPVAKNCRTPDIQSDDARYWIAATNKPRPGLGHDTTLTREQLDTLKAAVRTVLLYD